MRVAIIFTCAILAVLATVNTQAVVDGESNNWWIQVVVKPGNPSKVELKAGGHTYRLTRASWDRSKRAFTGKPSSEIPAGSSVSVVAYYPSGPKTTQLQWNYNGAPKYTGSGSSSSSGGSPKPPSAPVKVGKVPSGVNMAKVNAQINAFHGGAGTPAHVGGSENPVLKRWKVALNNAISANGVSNPKTRSMIHALFALETETIYDSNGNAQRDTGKDHDRLSKNYSPLNMNRDMLNEIGFRGDADALNKASNINLTVATLLRAITKLGFKPMMNFHRGGRTGFEHPNTAWLKIPPFHAGIAHMAEKFNADHALWTDGRKCWSNVPPV